MSDETDSLLGSLYNTAANRHVGLALSGLKNAEHVLKQLDLTRGLHFHSIGCFDSGESMKVMDEFCDLFGIEVGSNHEKLKELQVT